MTACGSQLRPFDRFYRAIVHSHLRHLQGGLVNVADNGGDSHYGRSESADGLEANIRVRRNAFYRKAVLGGDLGIAESLMDGDWECDDLTALVRIFIRSRGESRWLNEGAARLRQWYARWRHWCRGNTMEQARYNIHDHYDLGNAFFESFLDSTLSYSCGFFEDTRDTMYDASLCKIRRICSLLDLGTSDRLLEIGSGWGALAAWVASETGCTVTTTTISEQQYRYAQQRMERDGLQHLVDVRLEDYRHLKGKFDKIVSVEMIEAVGHEYLPTFFRKCGDLLTDDGVLAMQAIVMADDRYEDYLKSVDFIREYIFPGGCLPSISGLTQVAAEYGQLRLVRLDDFAPHYAETLRRWRVRFRENESQICRLGFDDRFLRMWDYYLSYCEAAFEERQVNLVQLVFAKKSSVQHPHFGAIASFRTKSQGFGHSPLPVPQRQLQ